MTRVLIVDDDVQMARMLARVVRHSGCDATVAGSGTEAIELGVRLRPDWMIVDWILGDAVHGLQVAAAVHAVRPETVTVVISGFALDDLDRPARDVGVAGVLAKPVDADRLLHLLSHPPTPPSAREPLGAFEVDRDGAITWANDRAARLLVPDGDVGGRLARELIGDELPWPSAGWVSCDRGLEVRSRAPWNDGRTLVLIRPREAVSNEALVGLVLGCSEVAPRRWPLPGRVLVVDDVPMIRLMASALIEAAGASCYTAGTHAEAMRLLAADPGVDLLLLDFEMPDGDVRGLIDQALALRPEVRIVGTSGADNREAFRARGVDRFVPKPWRLAELLAAVGAP